MSGSVVVLVSLLVLFVSLLPSLFSLGGVLLFDVDGATHFSIPFC